MEGSSLAPKTRTSSTEEGFPCEVCGKVLRSAHALKYHYDHVCVWDGAAPLRKKRSPRKGTASVVQAEGVRSSPISEEVVRRHSLVAEALSGVEKSGRADSHEPAGDEVRSPTSMNKRNSVKRRSKSGDVNSPKSQAVLTIEEISGTMHGPQVSELGVVEQKDCEGIDPITSDTVRGAPSEASCEGTSASLSDGERGLNEYCLGIVNSEQPETEITITVNERAEERDAVMIEESTGALKAKTPGFPCELCGKVLRSAVALSYHYEHVCVRGSSDATKTEQSPPTDVSPTAAQTKEAEHSAQEDVQELVAISSGKRRRGRRPTSADEGTKESGPGASVSNAESRTVSDSASTLSGKRSRGGTSSRRNSAADDAKLALLEPGTSVISAQNVGASLDVVDSGTRNKRPVGESGAKNDSSEAETNDTGLNTSKGKLPRSRRAGRKPSMDMTVGDDEDPQLVGSIEITEISEGSKRRRKGRGEELPIDTEPPPYGVAPAVTLSAEVRSAAVKRRGRIASFEPSTGIDSSLVLESDTPIDVRTESNAVASERRKRGRPRLSRNIGDDAAGVDGSHKGIVSTDSMLRELRESHEDLSTKGPKPMISGELKSSKRRRTPPNEVESSTQPDTNELGDAASVIFQHVDPEMLPANSSCSDPETPSEVTGPVTVADPLIALGEKPRGRKRRRDTASLEQTPAPEVLTVVLDQSQITDGDVPLDDAPSQPQEGIESTSGSAVDPTIMSDEAQPSPEARGDGANDTADGAIEEDRAGEVAESEVHRKRVGGRKKKGARKYLLSSKKKASLKHAIGKGGRKEKLGSDARAIDGPHEDSAGEAGDSKEEAVRDVIPLPLTNPEIDHLGVTNKPSKAKLRDPIFRGTDENSAPLKALSGRSIVKVRRYDNDDFVKPKRKFNKQDSAAIQPKSIDSKKKSLRTNIPPQKGGGRGRPAGKISASVDVPDESGKMADAIMSLSRDESPCLDVSLSFLMKRGKDRTTKLTLVISSWKEELLKLKAKREAEERAIAVAKMKAAKKLAIEEAAARKVESSIEPASNPSKAKKAKKLRSDGAPEWRIPAEEPQG